MALARTRVPRYCVRPHPLHDFANAELTSLFLFATLPICLALAWRPAAVPSPAITTSVLAFSLCAVWTIHLTRATSFVWATTDSNISRLSVDCVPCETRRLDRNRNRRVHQRRVCLWNSLDH